MDKTVTRIRAIPRVIVLQQICRSCRNNRRKYFFYGTAAAYPSAIAAQEISKQHRLHVHLSNTIQTALQVGSGTGNVTFIP